MNRTKWIGLVEQARELKRNADALCVAVEALHAKEVQNSTAKTPKPKAPVAETLDLEPEQAPVPDSTGLEVLKTLAQKREESDVRAKESRKRCAARKKQEMQNNAQGGVKKHLPVVKTPKKPQLGDVVVTENYGNRPGKDYAERMRATPF